MSPTFLAMYAYEKTKKALEGLIADAIDSSRLLPPGRETPKILLSAPKDYIHGDLTTNVMLKIASKEHPDTAENAGVVTERLNRMLKSGGLRDDIERAEFKRPGFINFFFTKKFLYGILKEITESSGNFGRSNTGRGRKVLIEFVSANPTGPLTIAHGRQAAIGDSLARILSFSGYRVYKEYYVNDVGVQIGLLASSIITRYLELFGDERPIPEGGYRGDYVMDIAKAIRDKFKDKFKENADKKKGLFQNFGIEFILKGIKKDLEDFGVSFDRFFHESALHRRREVEKALSALRSRGVLYEKEGAVWFASSGFGDDKDRVVKKRDGSYTYLAPDVAYHRNKFKRKMDTIVDLWGPDHHGYIRRLKYALKAIGLDESRVRIVIVQLVSLYEGARQIPMSTRKGEFLTLRRIMDEVGRDAARFFFVMRNTSSHLDFDMELARKHSLDNPVYYIQYAHARICSILNFSRGKLAGDHFSAGADASLLKKKEEMDSIRILKDFPDVVSSCARRLEPFGLVEYLGSLAAAFHRFYNKFRFVTEDRELSRSRLLLADATRVVLANGLKLLGITPLEKM